MTPIASNYPDFSAASYAALVRAFLSRRSPVEALDWLPVTSIAADAPERWVTAFQSLPLSDQYSMVALLRTRDAGPLAGSLLLMLAEHSGDLSDEQIQQIVTDQAPAIYHDQAAALQRVRDRVSVLGQTVGDRLKRLEVDFDLQAELIRLETELATIRLQELNQDERFSQVHSIENAILRMETRKRILDHYDQSARELWLHDLRMNVEERESAKRAVEIEIGTTSVASDTIKQEIECSRDQLQTAVLALSEAENKQREWQQELDTVRVTLKCKTEEVLRIQEEHQSLSAKSELAEEERQRMEEICQRERAKLEDMHAAARESGMENIVKKIEEVYCLLPADRADEGFVANRRKRP